MPQIRFILFYLLGNITRAFPSLSPRSSHTASIHF
jgi:hypothetical protein